MLQYILTIHSFAGSSLEASEPLASYGPFDEDIAQEYYDKLNDVFEELAKNGSEVMCHMTPITKTVYGEKPFVEEVLDYIKFDVFGMEEK